jgi:hypothetical protein
MSSKKTGTKNVVAKNVPAAPAKEKRHLNLSPDNRKRNAKGQTRKDVVFAYWNTHRDANVQTISKHVLTQGFSFVNESTIRSWIGTFSHGYNLPVTSLQSAGLRDKMSDAQRVANRMNGYLGETKIVPFVVSEKKIALNPACKIDAKS